MANSQGEYLSSTFPSRRPRFNTAANSASSSSRDTRSRVLSFSSETSVGSRRLNGAKHGERDAQVLSPTPRLHDLARDVPWLRASPSVAGSSRASSPAFQRYEHDAAPHDRLREKGKERERDERVESPARRWIKWMSRIGAADWVCWIVAGAALLVRWMVALGGFSGEGNPPMHGDYEAQRHWMEITLHLPPREWYYYDLPYWGLDYPPLTAYVSWICGWVGSKVNPDWFASQRSRGYESPSSKVYMRATVLLLDIALYVPCIIWFCRRWYAFRSRRTQDVAILALLLQPSLILIDHGHFQYNSVMLGLSLVAVLSFAQGKDLLGAAAFVASMSFKQMAIYYAPAIFGYLLGKCFWLGWPNGRNLFLQLAVVSPLVLVLTLAPFLPPFAPTTTVFQVVHRVFPLARGIFEDKVANFWCASDPIIHWRRRMSNVTLARTSLVVTFVAVSIPMAHLIRLSWTSGGTRARAASSPALRLLPWAMFNSAMAFFLFSFQVHEKTILLPLMPLSLLMVGRGADGEDPDGSWGWGVLVNNMAVFTMWPLLKKDGQVLQYFALTLFWNYAIGYDPFRIRCRTFVQSLAQCSYVLIAGLHVVEVCLPPPDRYPDLWVVMRGAVGCAVFGLSWLWGMRKQVEAGWSIGLFKRAA